MRTISFARYGLIVCYLAVAAGLFLGTGSVSAGVADEGSAVSVASSDGPLMAGTVGRYWDRFMDFVRDSVSSRRRMIQVVTIGACIGLFIMLRNKY